MTTTQTPPRMTVPFIDLKPQYEQIRAACEPKLLEIAASQYFVLGPEVAAFEKEIGQHLGVKHAVGCSSGSDALLLALMALNLKPGDEVLCPSWTFFATAGAISRLGLVPVFVDIDPVTYNMCPRATEEALKGCKRAKAILPVHIYGHPADVDAFLALGKKHNLPVIEDCAQSIGARDATGAITGTRCTMGTWSFFPTKNLGCFGDGGLVSANDDQLGQYLTMARVHGSKQRYVHEFVGVNARLDAIQAAILRIKLPHLESWHAGRIRNACVYDAAFTKAGALTTAEGWEAGGLPLRFPWRPMPPARAIVNQYVVRVPAAIRDDARAHLAANGIGSEIYYPIALHQQECWAHLGYGAGSLPETERAAGETIALPIFPELKTEQLAYVAETLAAFVAKSTKAAPLMAQN